jgi:hypothetical protein
MYALNAIVLTGLIVSTASEARAWATITVNSLADPGKPRICALRDAITAANTQTATNGCAAGNGHDTIKFSVTGTITLADTLPEVTDSNLTINGPASPGVTVERVGGPGHAEFQLMEVASGAALDLNNMTMTGGFAVFIPAGGGAILNNGTLTVTNSTISANAANVGAGIVNNGRLTVFGSTFLGNNALGFGGGIANEGTAIVKDSTFSGNSSAGIGNGSSLTVINSTFTDNSFSLFIPGGMNPGGGIFDTGGTVTVTNSTFSNNNGPGNVTVIAGGTASLKGTILINVPSIEFPATAPDCTQADAPPISDLGYNIANDDSCGFTSTGSLNNTDPMLDPAGLANNGGPTQTIALLSGSPAIDTIPLDFCTGQDGNPLTTDQRGFPRPDAAENVCDIGAYEFQDFAGEPDTRNCHGVSVFALAHQFGSIKAAASALRFPSVKALQAAITAFCRA